MKKILLFILVMLLVSCSVPSILLLNNLKYVDVKITLTSCNKEIHDYADKKEDFTIISGNGKILGYIINRKGERLLLGRPEYLLFEKIVYDSATYQLTDKAGKELRRDSVVFTLDEFNTFLNSEYDRQNYKKTISINIEADRIFENSMDSIAQ